MTNGNSTPDTIVLIHGLWLTPRSWERWADRYTSRGFRVLAPAWPGMEAEVEALNADPSPIARLTVERVVNHYERVVLGLDRPPLIVGHSFGGAVTQVLLDRGLGAAGLSIAPATVTAVPGSGQVTGGVVALTPEAFHHAFTNTMSREASDAVHARQHVPAPTAMLSKDAFANVSPDAPTGRDTRREHRAPLLLVRFGQDRLVPPSAVRPYQREGDEVIEILEFRGRPHYHAAPGWEEVADQALDWLVKHVAASGLAGPV